MGVEGLGKNLAKFKNSLRNVETKEIAASASAAKRQRLKDNERARKQQPKGENLGVATTIVAEPPDCFRAAASVDSSSAKESSSTKRYRLVLLQLSRIVYVHHSQQWIRKN